MILGSHACRTGILTLEHKGIEHQVVTIPTGLHPFLVRLRGFPAKERRELAGTKRPWILRLSDRMGTVPALRYGPDRIQTNRAITRFLEEVRPEPALFPADSDLRARVEEAERFGDEVLQMTARRLGLAAVLHGPDAMHERGGDGRLGPMLWHNDWMRFGGTRFLGPAVFGATRRTEPDLLEALPGMLDRIDAWVADGVLNGDELNAADFMFAPSLALLGYRRDLRPDLESRPLWSLVDRLLPEPA